jgi:hypothetical protein
VPAQVQLQAEVSREKRLPRYSQVMGVRAGSEVLVVHEEETGNDDGDGGPQDQYPPASDTFDDDAPQPTRQRSVSQAGPRDGTSSGGSGDARQRSRSVVTGQGGFSTSVDAGASPASQAATTDEDRRVGLSVCLVHVVRVLMCAQLPSSPCSRLPQVVVDAAVRQESSSVSVGRQSSTPNAACVEATAARDCRN